MRDEGGARSEERTIFSLLASRSSRVARRCAHLDDAAIGDHEDSIAWARRDLREPGELPEGGEDQAIATEVEAGQEMTLPRGAEELDPWMQVSGEPGAGAAVPGMMEQLQPAVDDRRISHYDIQRGVGIPRHAVVVPPHQLDPKCPMRGAPLHDALFRVRLPAGAGMQEVAENDQAVGTAALHEGRQPVERGARGPARDGDAVGTKTRRLADVDVGNEQRPITSPQHCALAEQVEEVAVQLELDSVSHCPRRRNA